MSFPRLPFGSICCVLMTAMGGHAQATETVRLKDHPELKRLYLATNELYRAAAGCQEQEDCICLHKEAVAKALEHFLKVRVEHDEIINTFIEDEQGVLQGPKGRGALVRVSEVRTIQRKLEQCTVGGSQVRLDTGEAPTTLRAIYVAETAHYAEFNRYAPMKAAGFLTGCDVPPELGFELEGCANGALRYVYSVRIMDKGQGFIAEARTGSGDNNKVYPGCAVADVWTLDQDQHLTHVSGGPSKCSAPIPPKTKPPTK